MLKHGQGSNGPSNTGCSTGKLSSLPSVIADLESLLTKVFGPSRAPAAFLTASQNLKESFAAPLEGLSARASRADVSFAASCFLARKVLPSTGSPAQLKADYISKMGRIQTPNTSFVAHVDSMIPSMFPIGWDSRYVAYCDRALPTSGASFGTSSKNGGSRAEIRAKMSRSEFVTACSTGEGVSIGADRKVRLIDDGGKVRIVTIADAAQSVLGPLHHLIYDHLSRRKDILKGSATGNSFKEFQRVKGEVFVSGDYESATDNFNRHHSEAIIRALARCSPNIPKPVWELAIQSLSGNIIVDGVSHPQVAGQLMGNLLSFPLLCLTNLLALKLAIPRHIPLRINGDDIVFRCTLAEWLRWKEVVSEAGLTLSVGKTLVHERYFSLNSTFFEGRTGRVPSLIPVVRAKAVYAPLMKGDGMSLAARLMVSCKGMQGWQRGIVKGHVLRWHRSAAKAVGCSLNRALGVRVTHEALVHADLLDHEISYLKLPSQLDKPRLYRPAGLDAKAPTPTSGWRKVPVRWFDNTKVTDPLTGRLGTGPFSTDIVRSLGRMWGEHLLGKAWDGESGEGLDRRMAPPIIAYNELPTSSYNRLMRTSVRGLARLRKSADRRHSSVKRWLYDRHTRRSGPEMIWVPEDWVDRWRPPPTFVRGTTGKHPV